MLNWKTLLGCSSRLHQVVFECRRCGATLDGEAAQCEQCGSPEIAQYQF